ncbi:MULTISPECIES: pyruvate kinase [Caproicibacterium]|uniref:Pyruvate kinase n=1 Tax=Caproicibacterium argilliputei TaxID=3030016 RepID=A0AA97H052_9FIRM|nr:pyruvate kinase [Caproicibacterium argilliputei]WOC31201.1 pyruvate kinase [Caproicibacterium argilliputei]
MRKTKIICTLGPATDDKNVLRGLMLAGMDVARVNFSHGSHEEHQVRIDTVKELREELGLPVALLLDTKGPEIRTLDFPKPVDLVDGQKYILTTEDVPGDNTRCGITFKNLPNEVFPGTRILIDDGLVELRVDEATNTEVFCTVMNGGRINKHKGINIPGVNLSLPFLSEQDKSDIAFGVEQDFDMIAASFVRCADDIISLRSELEKNGNHDMQVISKIESTGGVENIDDIIRVSDGIMVARGDLGVEVPMEEVPVLQKEIISKVFAAGKLAITATQMLDSMIQHPRPTRAEATDVANAVYDGTSAIMLSGETAAGKYPVEAVKTMARIAERTERSIDYTRRFRTSTWTEKSDVTSAISHATCTTAHDLGAAAIMTVTKSGRTARTISKYRPACPIISGTTSRKVWYQMNLSWGVIPIMVDEKKNTDELFDHVVNIARKQGLVKDGDLTVITAGVPLGISGTTNLVKVQLVGDVLVTGAGISLGSICSNLCVCKNQAELAQNFHTGDIIVVPSTSNDIMKYMRKASGIITEEQGMNSHAAIVGLSLNKPVIVGAENATKILRSGVTVTLDSDRGIVYNGVEKAPVTAKK